MPLSPRGKSFYRATSASPATSITPPTKCKLPATRTSTPPSSTSNSTPLTTLIACSIEGKTWTSSVGNSGIRDFQTAASSLCIFTRLASAVSIWREARSTPERMVRTRYEWVEVRFLFQKVRTSFELAVRVGDIRAEDDGIKEPARRLFALI